MVRRGRRSTGSTPHTLDDIVKHEVVTLVPPSGPTPTGPGSVVDDLDHRRDEDTDVGQSFEGPCHEVTPTSERTEITIH